jgi:hypothetical protein
MLTQAEWRAVDMAIPLNEHASPDGSRTWIAEYQHGQAWAILWSPEEGVARPWPALGGPGSLAEKAAGLEAASAAARRSAGRLAGSPDVRALSQESG